MRVLLAVVSLWLFNASAVEGVPCAGRVGVEKIEFSGQSGPAALMTYFVKLTFDPGKAGFRYETNWGRDIKGELDIENLQEVWTWGYTTMPQSGQCSARVTPGNCLSSAQNLITYLTVMKTNIYESQVNIVQKMAALDCAIQRSNYFADLVQVKYVQRRNLDPASR